MIDLGVVMCNIKFKNPVLCASCGMTATLDRVKNVLSAGVGGIVLKTVTDIDFLLNKRCIPMMYSLAPVGLKGNLLASERMMISPEKAATFVPDVRELCEKAGVRLIVSIKSEANNLDGWRSLAMQMEKLGAEALELNLTCPNVIETEAGTVEIPAATDPKCVFEICKAVKEKVQIPVSPKLTPMFDMSEVIHSCNKAKVDFISAFDCGFDGLVINVDKEEVFGLPIGLAGTFGRAVKIQTLLRIKRIMDKLPNTPISAIGGIWSGKDVAEYILLGCYTTQAATVTYLNGPEVFRQIIDELVSFMEDKGHKSLEDFRGKVYNQLKNVSKRDIAVFEAGLTNYAIKPLIEDDTCTECLKCINSCPSDAIRMEETVVIDRSRCNSCGLCVSICPVNAIKMIDHYGNEYWDGKGTIRIASLNQKG